MTREEIDLALKRLGAGKDGQVLVDLLFDELQRVSGPMLDGGALRHIEGRRSFALDLIRRLSPPDEASSGRTDASSTDANPRRPGGTRRRVAAAEPGSYPER